MLHLKVADRPLYLGGLLWWSRYHQLGQLSLGQRTQDHVGQRPESIKIHLPSAEKPAM